MAFNIAVGFSLWFYDSNASSSSFTIDLRTAPVCFFFPQFSGGNVLIAPEVSEVFDITKLTPVGFEIGSYSVNYDNSQEYGTFTATSNSGWSLSGYELTFTGSSNGGTGLNQIVGMLLF